MMIKFSVGCTWDRKLLDEIVLLNNMYSSKGREVYELYGSFRSDVFGLRSARPDFRMPELTVKEFRDFVATAHSSGIRINYTINSPLCESVSQLVAQQNNIIDGVKRLKEWGVDTFTVANSIIFEMLCENTDATVEVSSVLHVHSVSQIPFYANWSVSQICMDVIRNRDISFLKAFCGKAREHAIETKLLVNEMCSIGGAPCAGIYQADCVLHSALGGNQEGLFDHWPFSRCHKSREANPAAWLKSRFLLPQWISKYADATGITHYKITGRTCPTDWLIKVVRAYISAEYSGDIRALWINPGVMQEQREMSRG